MAENAYYTLLTSLPHIDSLFHSKVTPISRIQLDRRLSMLSKQERDVLIRVEQLTHWSHMGTDVDENVLIRLATKLQSELPGQEIRELISWRMDVRTIIAALRRKAQGGQAPAAGRWSFGNRYTYIRLNWNSPTLGLQHAFPWIPKVAECLSKNDHITLEKTLLGTVWHQLDILSSKHRFDFEAVIIYVLRWHLIDRWTRYNSDKALTYFRALTDIALGDFVSQLPDCHP
ncbi:hypothetical protein CI610_00427 [invertebrate metagenome]|uniref:V-type ATP synthase subunit C n=1 Tax=invertebrate metagenome TaxID=1711999 RepID=A0A2H9TBH9_9ZZZZ